VFGQRGALRRRVPPLYPLPRAHEGRAGMSAVDSATCWGRLGGAVAAGRRRPFVLVFHRALPDLQRMKHKPDQAFGHREVFCFLLVFHRALPDLQRMKLCYSAARRRHRGRYSLGATKPDS
jgi:hypothetical protein